MDALIGERMVIIVHGPRRAKIRVGGRGAKRATRKLSRGGHAALFTRSGKLVGDSYMGRPFRATSSPDQREWLTDRAMTPGTFC